MDRDLINKLIAQVGEILAQDILGWLKRDHSCMIQPYPGAVWISVMGDGKVYSCYYHPTQKHTATTIGAVGEKKSIANGGEWAISYQKKALFGNKTHYNTI